MMLKILGILTILITSILIGFEMSKKELENHKFLKNYFEFILKVKTEINFVLIEIKEIFIKYSEDSSTFGSFLKNCILKMETKNFKEAWIDSLDDVNTKIKIPSDCREMIKNFGLGLGVSDREGQNEHCEYHYNQMKFRLQSLNDVYEKKIKLYKVLGICVGLLFCLILV